MEFEEFKDAVDTSLCDTKHTLWNNIYEDEIANLPREINLVSDLKLEEEEQTIGLLSIIVIFFLIVLFSLMQNVFFFIVNFKENDSLKMINDPMKIIKIETTKEIKEVKTNDSIILSKFEETYEFKKKDANTIKKNRNLKGKRRKKNVIIKDKQEEQEEQEDCIDVETISGEIPGN